MAECDTVKLMRRGPIRVLELSGSARERGLAHGEQFRDEIREYARDRIDLTCRGVWNGRSIERAAVLDLAERCLPAHQEYSPELTAELCAVAYASGCSVPEVLIAGGFTDIVDAVYAELGETTTIEDDCTAVVVADERADGAGFLAQTWDMHASALEHVLLLDIRPDDGPRALVLSTTGCLGQLGMNEAGICVGINNLSGTEGGVGVTWPHVVRKAMLATEFDAALACITEAPLAGAHNYMLRDGDGRGCNVEAFSTLFELTELDDNGLAHTNHPLSAQTQAVSQEKAEPLRGSSEARLRQASSALAQGTIGFEDVVELTRHPALCYAPAPPLDLATCGAVIMRPRVLDFWACWGPPSEDEYEHFSLARTAAA